MAEREDWRELFQLPDSDILDRFADINEALLHRAGPVLVFGEAATLNDPELAGPRDHGHNAQRNVCRQLATELRARGLLTMVARDGRESRGRRTH